jgi:predicted aspartyl protease
MSIIKHPLLYSGTEGEKYLYTLFDSGANLSCIHPDHADGLALPQHLGRTRRVSTASETHFIVIEYRITVNFYINDLELSDEFLIVPGLTEEVIIGAATMQKWRIKLDFEHDCLIVDPRVTKMQII